jgi:hypothetical protein
VDRKVEGNGAVVVDWSRVLPGHARDAFWQRVHDTERGFADRGRCYQVPAGRIRAEGEDPRDAWPAYRDMIAAALGGGLKLVGHNIVYFDCPLLSRVGDQMDSPLDFQAHQLLDFGLFEKALSAGLELPHPAKGTLEQWYRYVKSAFAKGKWSLTPHCVEKYNLGADQALAHGADYDCWISHQLVEAHRAIVEGKWPSSSPDSSTPARSMS